MRKRVNRQRILILIFIGILIIVTTVTLIITWIPFQTSENVSNLTYQEDRFKTKSGFKYYDDDRYESVIGVDVSSNQTAIDWKKVKQSGVSFAMIRCGYRGTVSGKIHADTSFKTNIENALENNLEVGVYFYSSAITKKEAVAEADYVLDHIKEYDLSYPVAFDMEHQENSEVRIDTLTKQQKTDIAKAFCKEIEDQGYQAIIYGNANWLTMDIDLDQLKSYGIWYAGYQKQPAVAKFSIWQYSNSGSLPGVDTQIDMNIRVTKKD